jgi:hypothetical protein
MVDLIPASHVRETLQRVHAARQRAGEVAGPPPRDPDGRYWESWFEANAAAALEAVQSVTLSEGFTVRYRCYGAQGRDLRIRPFVARTGTDVTTIRRLIDWHPPPDSMSQQERHTPTQDIELLYRHFRFARTPTGIFDYWLVMQELWGSARWTHSLLIASAEEMSQLTSAEGWKILHAVERYEPAAVIGDESARLAVLVHCPLERFTIQLLQIDIDAQQALHYAEPILVASGPRGWVL